MSVKHGFLREEWKAEGIWKQDPEMNILAQIED